MSPLPRGERVRVRGQSKSIPLKLPLLLTPLTYIHVGNPCLLPRGEKAYRY